MKRIGVITGATSGIGASFANILAERGYELLLTGRREAKIRSLAESLRNRHNVTVHVIIVELSDPGELESLVGEICKLPYVDILINNAGFGLAAKFHENEADHRSMLQTHIHSPERLIRLVLPGMMERRSGYIINVASVASFLPTPRGSTYSATKAYLVSISESIHMEVSKYGVRVQALCPGLTTTDFHSRERTAGDAIRERYRFAWADSDKVAAKSLSKLAKKKVIYIPGVVNKGLVLASRLMPRRLYYRLASAARGR